jgi:serine protease inhibitor
MHYYELKKLPEPTDGDEEIKFWLAFFKAQTEEELNKLTEMGVPVMSEAVAAYQSLAHSSEFREIERLRERARHNEAAALGHAARVAAKAAAKAARDEMTAEFLKRMQAANISPDMIEKLLPQ